MRRKKVSWEFIILKIQENIPWTMSLSGCLYNDGKDH